MSFRITLILNFIDPVGRQKFSSCVQLKKLSFTQTNQKTNTFSRVQTGAVCREKDNFIVFVAVIIVVVVIVIVALIFVVAVVIVTVALVFLVTASLSTLMSLLLSLLMCLFLSMVVSSSLLVLLSSLSSLLFLLLYDKRLVIRHIGFGCVSLDAGRYAYWASTHVSFTLILSISVCDLCELHRKRTYCTCLCYFCCHYCYSCCRSGRYCCCHCCYY